MKLTFYLLLSLVFIVKLNFICALNAAESVDKLSSVEVKSAPDLKFAESRQKIHNHDIVLKGVQNFARNLQNARTNMLEKYSNPSFLKAEMAKLDRVDGKSEDVVNLASSELVQGRKLDDVDEFGGFAQYILEQCQAEIDAVLNLAGGNFQQNIQALIDCIKQVFLNAVQGCLADFPGVLDPVECLIDLSVSTDNLDFGQLSESGFDFKDGELDSEFEIDDSASDSANGFSSKFDDLLDNTDVDISNLDLADCSQIFGTANDPDFFACLALFNADDFAAFKAAVQDAFANNADCQVLVNLLDLDNKMDDDNYDLFDEFFFKDLDFLQDDDFDLCSQDGVENELLKYVEAFQKCSQNDNGALQAELNARYGGSAGTVSISIAAVLSVIGITNAIVMGI